MKTADVKKESMTLDEAIIHCEEVANKCSTIDGYLKCEEDHRQLAEWLRQLKQYLSLKEIVLQAGMEGKEVDFHIGGRLFSIREKAQ